MWLKGLKMQRIIAKLQLPKLTQELKIMTAHQQEKLTQLENELGLSHGTLPIRGESDGYVFTEVDGVTVLITTKSSNPRGGYKLPSVRTYSEVSAPTNLDAAVRAKNLFEKQDPNPEYMTGHLSPVVQTNWKCATDRCPCNSETYPVRKKRSIGQ